ncbi:hypothetical protein [Breznakia pachnodae]|uniref:Uncharacterized protein n=1 Tax=Breznakia pachnodae TaxID=265178 RepID=A0ABU0E3T0_9FIRM|nr:hypothetical protein [Breznakia pachnodae]MDQ0361558.1 hypothetical protein [Breznakia pachnodae]
MQNKIVFCGDTLLYEKIYKHYEYTDEDGNVLGSYFSEDDYNFYHLTNRDYINFIINPIDGIKNIRDLIIQKSWYSNSQLLKILNRIKLFNPNINVVVCMDVVLEKNEIFMHEIVSKQLGYIAINEYEIGEIIGSDYEVDQSNYILKKVKKKQIKKMIKS